MIQSLSQGSSPLADAPLLSHFAATLAHRLRNPLTGISTAIQLMQMQGLGSQLHDLIAQEIQRIDGVVKEMLHFADQSLEPPQEIALESSLLPHLPCERDFIWDGLDAHLYVVCRPLELSQVLHTLLHYLHAVTPTLDPLYIQVTRHQGAPHPHLALRLAQTDQMGTVLCTGRTGWLGDEEDVPGSSMALSMVQTILLSYGLQLRAQKTLEGSRILIAELPITWLDVK
jgi:hypothetical protein